MNGTAPADDNLILNVDTPRANGRLTVAALHRAVPVRLWGGKGCGAACDFCRVLVSATDIEYEVEAELDGQRLTLHFHQRCHDAWRAEVEGSLPEAQLKDSA